jgi:hypothetical protein
VNVLLCAAVMVAGLAAPAAADSRGTLQAQADRLAAQISSGVDRAGALTAQYNQAAQRSAALTSQLAATGADLDRSRRGIGDATDVLRHEAIAAYMGADTGGTPVATVAGEAMDLVLRREYLEVANGNLGDALDRFHAAVAGLQVREDSLRQGQAAAASAATKLIQARAGALAAAAQAGAALAQVHGELADLVVKAEAAKAAKAHQSVVATAPQGLPVNGGLAVAVANAVAAPAAPAPGPSPAPAPAPAAPPPPAAVVTGGAGGVWAALRNCESSGNYAENTGNGYYGAYQFSLATWSGLGYPGRPDQASAAMQDEAAQRLQARSGWGQWPACAAALGLQ